MAENRIHELTGGPEAWRYDYMKFPICMAVNGVLLAAVATGQQAQPGPVAPPADPKTAELPTPSGTPEPQSAPDLLPESGALPAEPPDLRLPSPSVLKPAETNAAQTEQMTVQLSPEEQQKNRIRLSEIRAIAMRNPRVINLLREANGALTDEARREFMRAYYHTLCTRMRMLEPGLTGAISDYERSEIRRLALGPSHLLIVMSRQPQHRDRQRHARRPE
ncbi:MAG: hypothetical protein JO207_00675 [Verrucomicrobia bacterium]|nr:hypothetical protein [Verrucomicrobiota bacterium]